MKEKGCQCNWPVSLSRLSAFLPQRAVDRPVLLGKPAAAAPEKGKIVPDVKIHKGDGTQGALRQLLPDGGFIQKGNAAARFGKGFEGGQAAGSG